jgi:hypothetical protein
VNKENLRKANKLNTEIENLENFISTAEKLWTGKLIKRSEKYIFKANGYGAIKDVEVYLDNDMKNKVLDILKIRLKEMQQELKNI